MSLDSKPNLIKLGLGCGKVFYLTKSKVLFLFDVEDSLGLYVGLIPLSSPNQNFEYNSTSLFHPR